MVVDVEIAAKRVVMALLKPLVGPFGSVVDVPSVPPVEPGTIYGVSASLCFCSRHLVSFRMAIGEAVQSFTSLSTFYIAASWSHTNRCLNSIAADLTVSPSSAGGCRSSNYFSSWRRVSLLITASRTTRKISSIGDASLARIKRNPP